jgi:multiple sugar transport system substrate-binding protein
MLKKEKNTMKHRSLLFVLSVGLAVVMILSGCGAGAPDAGQPAATDKPAAPDAPTVPATPGEKTTIKVMSFFAYDNPEVETAVVAAFEAANPDIKVEFESVPMSDIFLKYKTLIAGNVAPDVMAFNYDNAYIFGSMGALAKLDSFIANSGYDTSTIYQATLDMFKVDGVQYSMPATFSDVVLFYNKALFDAAGLAYPTRTWGQAELKAAAIALTKDTNGDGKIDQWGYTFPWWPVVLEMYGGKIWEGKTCTMNSAQGVKAIQSIVDARYVDKYSPTADNLAEQGDWDMFIAGKLAMFPTGPWAVQPFNDKITNFTYDIAHMPAGDRQATHVYSNSYGMSATSTHQDAAWKFIAFATGPEGTKIRQDGKYEISPVKQIAETYYLSALAGDDPEHAIVFMEVQDYAVPQPVHANWNQIFDAIQPELDLALTQAEPVQQALDNACVGVNAALNP